jgi:hypothetical protein
MSRTAEAAIHPPLFLPNPDSPLNTPGASWVLPLNELDHKTSLYNVHEATVNEGIVQDALQAQQDARQLIKVNNKKCKAPTNWEDNKDECQSEEPLQINNDDKHHMSLKITEQKLDGFTKEAHKDKWGTKEEWKMWPGLCVYLTPTKHIKHWKISSSHSESEKIIWSAVEFTHPVVWLVK